ncbi:MULTISPECIES: hypothetical protein [Amycolatopsis]|uniref:Uncharacterized protein n=1 Tax=Amycolatopsis echigonensis TaxID=2576905 RepID=A0A2N3WFC0_9PSEU|nr:MULTISPECIES: hypothetical protein [Amycolatopsis]PKV92584.1 hypothetical protein ATK30_3404 [Amycolatopsis niigatensis]UIJ59835.1 hypothetical protein LWP59_38630 [Amycolatopsis acidiphila]GHG62926.1 hypothetical protein GCM10017788_18940 [Amycolatopsis acidiphila]
MDATVYTSEHQGHTYSISVDNERNPYRRDWEVGLEHADQDGKAVDDWQRGSRAFSSRDAQLEFVRRRLATLSGCGATAWHAVADEGDAVRDIAAVVSACWSRRYRRRTSARSAEIEVGPRVPSLAHMDQRWPDILPQCSLSNSGNSDAGNPCSAYCPSAYDAWLSRGTPIGFRPVWTIAANRRPILRAQRRDTGAAASGMPPAGAQLEIRRYRARPAGRRPGRGGPA